MNNKVYNIKKGEKGIFFTCFSSLLQRKYKKNNSYITIERGIYEYFSLTILSLSINVKSCKLLFVRLFAQKKEGCKVLR